MKFLDRDSIPIPMSLYSKRIQIAKDQLDGYLDLEPELRAQQRPELHLNLLRSSDLQDALVELTGGNCAYCECYIAQENDMVIDPFRPNMNAGNNQKSTQLEYYTWLTYEWENILLSCVTCSNSKRNLFPVKGKRGDIRASIDKLRESENASLIDPCWDSPYLHLSFRPNGLATPKSEKGYKSIDTFNLNRKALVSDRKRVFLDLFQRAVTAPNEIKLSETNSENPKEQFVFSDCHYPGAATSLFMDGLPRILALDDPEIDIPNLAALMRELQNKTEQQRAIVFRVLQGIPEEAPETQKWEENERASSSFFSSIMDFVAPNKEGVEFRSKQMDSMVAALDNISTVKIQNFKALKHIEFSLRQKKNESDPTPCMIILGENSTGKSSVLEAIALAITGTQESANLAKDLKKDELSPKNIVHRTDIGKPLQSDDKLLQIDVHFQHGSTPTTISAKGKDRSLKGNENTAKLVMAYGPRRYFGATKKSQTSSASYRIRSLFDPLATMPDPVEWLLKCSNTDFKAVARAMKDILMLSEVKAFVRTKNEIIVTLDDEPTPFRHLSVGYQSVLTMTVDIIRELLNHFDNTEHASAVVLIDEIETHLHPRWKMRIMGLLRKALPKVQFIVTTHDPLCLRGMHDGEIFVLYKDSHGNIEQIDELPSIKGMRAEQLLTSEFFGLGTTDPETDAKLSRMHRLVSMDDRSDEQNDELAQLRETIGRMPVGNTFQEQVLMEAAKKTDFDPFAPLEKVTSQTRKNMLSDALSSLEDDGIDDDIR